MKLNLLRTLALITMAVGLCDSVVFATFAASGRYFLVPKPGAKTSLVEKNIKQHAVQRFTKKEVPEVVESSLHAITGRHMRKLDKGHPLFLSRGGHDRALFEEIAIDDVASATTEKARVDLIPAGTQTAGDMVALANATKTIQLDELFENLVAPANYLVVTRKSAPLTERRDVYNMVKKMGGTEVTRKSISANTIGRLPRPVQKYFSKGRQIFLLKDATAVNIPLGAKIFRDQSVIDRTKVQLDEAFNSLSLKGHFDPSQAKQFVDGDMGAKALKNSLGVAPGQTAPIAKASQVLATQQPIMGPWTLFANKQDPHRARMHAGITALKTELDTLIAAMSDRTIVTPAAADALVAPFVLALADKNIINPSTYSKIAISDLATNFEGLTTAATTAAALPGATVDTVKDAVKRAIDTLEVPIADLHLLGGARSSVQKAADIVMLNKAMPDGRTNKPNLKHTVYAAYHTNQVEKVTDRTSSAMGAVGYGIGAGVGLVLRSPGEFLKGVAFTLVTSPLTLTYAFRPANSVTLKKWARAWYDPSYYSFMR